jgi:hypothetical protein
MQLSDSQIFVLLKYIKKAEEIVTPDLLPSVRSVREKVSKPNMRFTQEEKDLIIGLVKIFMTDDSTDELLRAESINILKELEK